MRDIELAMKNKMWDLFQTRLGQNPTKMSSNERAKMEEVFKEIMSISESYAMERFEHDMDNDYAWEISDLRNENACLQEDVAELQRENEELRSVGKEKHKFDVGLLSKLRKIGVDE